MVTVFVDKEFDDIEPLAVTFATVKSLVKSTDFALIELLSAIVTAPSVAIHHHLLFHQI